MKFSLLLPRETEDVREVHLKKIYMYMYICTHTPTHTQFKKEATENSYGISLTKSSILLGKYQKARLGGVKAKVPKHWADMHLINDSPIVHSGMYEG